MGKLAVKLRLAITVTAVSFKLRLRPTCSLSVANPATMFLCFYSIRVRLRSGVTNNLTCRFLFALEGFLAGSHTTTNSLVSRRAEAELPWG